jgi:hypothetical protein
VLPDSATVPAGAIPRDTPTDPSGDGLTPWETARDSMDWKQGEHVTIIGPTGQGKTTLALDLMRKRGYPLILATKPRDTTMERMRREGWHIIRDWPPTRDRTILWPKMTRPTDKPDQARVIEQALNNVYTSGGYAVLIDELSYVLSLPHMDTRYVKSGEAVAQIWQQGRALNISLVSCILRPSHIPLLAYDQATHIIMFRDNDETNLKRMGGLGHWSRREIIDNVSQLNRHEFLMLNTRTGEMLRSKTTPGGIK